MRISKLCLGAVLYLDCIFISLMHRNLAENFAATTVLIKLEHPHPPQETLPYTVTLILSLISSHWTTFICGTRSYIYMGSITKPMFCYQNGLSVAHRESYGWVSFII